MLTKADLDRCFFNHGFEPVTTDIKEFHNYRRIVQFGFHITMVSVLLAPDVLDADSAEEVFADAMAAANRE